MEQISKIEDKMSNCQVCRVKTNLKCICGSVFYCSKPHQKKDWKNHKLYCTSAFQIKTSDELGRHLIATRKIKAGEVFFIEKPLTVSFAPQCQRSLLKNTESQCFSCGSLLESGFQEEKYCENKCGWRYCGSESCKNSEFHKFGECSVFKSAGGLKKLSRNENYKIFQKQNNLFEIVGILRALGLEKSEPESFTKLMNLQPNYFNYEFDNMALIVKKTFKLAQTTETIMKIMGIFFCNSFDIPLFDARTKDRFGDNTGLYYFGSLFEHICLPNCGFTFDSKTFEMRIMAKVDIESEDHLSISYCDSFYPIFRRQESLEPKCFSCKCPRCEDPTELGTHFSTLLCTEDNCKGYIQSIKSDDENENGNEDDLKCSVCGKEYIASYENITYETTHSILVNCCNDIRTNERFLSKYEGIFHENHSIFYQTRINLITLYEQELDRNKNSVSISIQTQILIIKKQMRYLEKLLQIVNNLYPGFDRERARILYYLARNTLVLKEHRELPPGSSNMNEIKTWLQISHQTLKYEPINSPKNEISKHAKDLLEKKF